MPRLTIEFPESVDKIIKELAKKNQTTKVEVLRRALSLYYYVRNETEGSDQKLSITDKDDKIVKDLIFS
jgi:hypothetical protein